MLENIYKCDSVKCNSASIYLSFLPLPDAKLQPMPIISNSKPRLGVGKQFCCNDLDKFNGKTFSSQYSNPFNKNYQYHIPIKN